MTPPCPEPSSAAFLEPVSAITSLAFVVAAALILVWRHRLAYAALVAGIGIGSLVQHGPNPGWADLAHDLPLLGTLALIAADGAADLTRRPRQWWWWALPTAALAPLVHLAPRAGDLAQVAVAAVATAVTMVRAWRRPAIRRPVTWALSLLAAGGLTGTLSRAGGPLCVPGSIWQGHAAWHLLAAAGLAVLAGVIGRVIPSPR